MTTSYRTFKIAKPSAPPGEIAIYATTEALPDRDDGRIPFYVTNGAWYGSLAPDKKSLRVEYPGGNESEDLDCIIVEEREVTVEKDDGRDPIPY